MCIILCLLYFSICLYFAFIFLQGIYIEKVIHKVILLLAGIRHLACFPNYATLSL